MSTYYLLNAATLVSAGAVVSMRPGRLIDDALIDITLLQNAGGQLWPSADPLVAAAATLCASRMTRGANDAELESIMRGAVDESGRSTSASAGASETGLADAGGQYAAADVEAAFAELPGQLRARAVVGTLGAYTATGGVLTVTATGALSAADGVTLVAGDIAFVPEGIANVTAADAGPYGVTAVGDATTSAKLTRPGWWSHGMAIRQGVKIQMSGEGTLFGGSAWKSNVGKGKLVGTDAPLFYPDFVSQIVTLSTGAATVTNVPIKSTSSMVVFKRTAVGGTVTTTVQYNAGTITPGALGTASVAIAAQIATGGTNTSDTSTGVVGIWNE